MNLVESVDRKFRELFNGQPLLVRSPGRANLIGEHTDYNLGYVLPCAIDRAIYFALAPRNDMKCVFYAIDKGDLIEGRVDKVRKSEKTWPNYLLGVVDELRKRGSNIQGFSCVFGGDIPIGAGLSSSAALEAGLAFGLNQLFDIGLDKLTLVRMAQRSENEFVGVQCGIMDQFINIFGESGSVMRLDCRSLEYEHFPFDDEKVSIVLFNSNVPHSLGTSEYNQRKKECEEGVAIIGKRSATVQSLRDVSMELLNDSKSLMSPTVYRRCKYVVEENARVVGACAALKKNDMRVFGRYMFETHDGLRRDYEVSCPELDYLADVVRGEGSVYGARMMGGGFGGCTVNLVEPASATELGMQVGEKYFRKFGIKADVYVTRIASGTSMVNVNENTST
jgi:galactokinase